MLYYRVFPYLPAALSGESFSPTFAPPQGMGRVDNPDLYTCWYFARDPSGAIGESFGDLCEWSDDMLLVPTEPRARKVLGSFQLPDDLNLLDLDDGNVLSRYGLRPTQVVEPRRSVTQRWARTIAGETRPGTPTFAWDGVSWWSLHRPHWQIIAVWVRKGDKDRAEFKRIESLDREHPAVQSAMTSLNRKWVVCSGVTSLTGDTA